MAARKSHKRKSLSGIKVCKIVKGKVKCHSVKRGSKSLHGAKRSAKTDRFVKSR